MSRTKDGIRSATGTGRQLGRDPAACCLRWSTARQATPMHYETSEGPVRRGGGNAEGEPLPVRCVSGQLCQISVSTGLAIWSLKVVTMRPNRPRRVPELTPQDRVVMAVESKQSTLLHYSPLTGPFTRESALSAAFVLFGLSCSIGLSPIRRQPYHDKIS